MDTETFETDEHLHVFKTVYFIYHISSDEQVKLVLFFIIVLCYKVDPTMGLKGVSAYFCF